MRKLALAVPFVLAFAACGSDTKSCTTDTAAVTPTNGCSALQASSTVTIQLRASCQSCAQTSPSCSTDPTDATTFHLDTLYRTCVEDQGCGGTSCANPPPTFSCNITTPASGTVTIFYNTASSIQPVSLPVSSGGQASCTL